MPEFVFAYHGGGRPETPEQGERVMAAWTAWYGEMGDKVVNGGNPVMQSYTVSKDGVTEDGGPNPISGYTVVSAENIEEATEMAKGCPMVQDGTGTVEVAETFRM